MARYILFITILLSLFQKSYSQYGNYTQHEFGIMAGPAFLKSDFGERNDLKSYVGNVGYNIGAFYYIPSSPYRTDFTENFKVRLDVSYVTTTLQHYGKYVEPKTEYAKKLAGMRSKVKALNASAQIEYYPFKTEEYSRGYSFYPYIALGPEFTSFSVEAYSHRGPIGTPISVSEKYYDGFKSVTGTTFSIFANLGTKIKIDDYQGVIIEAQAQYYFTDWMDGMNPSRRIYKENKTNDWMVMLNVGYSIIID